MSHLPFRPRLDFLDNEGLQVFLRTQDLFCACACGGQLIEECLRTRSIGMTKGGPANYAGSANHWKTIRQKEKG